MGANLAAAPGSYGQRVASGERFAQNREALTAIRRQSEKNPQEKVAMIQRDVAEPSQNVRQRRPFGPKSGTSGRETDFHLLAASRNTPHRAVIQTQALSRPAQGAHALKHTPTCAVP